MSIFQELKRRNVFRVAIAYLIIAWFILQVGDTLAPALHLDEWVNSVLVFFLILGFPLALVFAWAFEITPEGIKKEKDVDRTESMTSVTGRKLDYTIIAVLVLALTYFAFDKFVIDPAPNPELAKVASEAGEQTAGPGDAEFAEKSIAVLAFTDLSAEGNQEYFSDGISEELLNVLAKIPGLRVAARTSSFRFKGENRDVIDIGQELNVAFVLEGSVRKAGPQVRITAQLIDARNGFHLWSENYDRELANIFAVQDEISAAIVGALKEHLGLQVETAPRVVATTSTEAHEAYLRGRHLVVQRTTATVEGSVSEFEKAVTLDPDYALAHAELAIAILLLNRTQYGSLTTTETMARATPYAGRAMDLDPNLAEAHAAIGNLLWNQEKPEEALAHFEQAVRINPNYSIVHTWMGTLLASNLGRYADAFVIREKAIRIDPLSIPAIANYVIALTARNRLAEAKVELEKLVSIAPGFYGIYQGLFAPHGGKWADRVLSDLNALKVEPGSGWARDQLTWDFAAIGLENEALAISKTPWSGILNWLGKPGDAVSIAELRLAEDSGSLARRDLGLALAGAGDYARAQPILEEMWQRSGGLIAGDFSFIQADHAAALIAIRRATHEDASVDELVAAIEDNVRRNREAGRIRADQFFSVDYEEGLAAYLAGEHDRGLELIAKAAEEGFFIPQKEAYLQTLYDDQGFADIRAMQMARQIRERERFLAIVCTDNPYAAVWQPAEGTCEQFAAGVGAG